MKANWETPIKKKRSGEERRMMKEAVVGVISQPILRSHILQNTENELRDWLHGCMAASFDTRRRLFLSGPNFANSRVESRFERRHRPPSLPQLRKMEEARPRRGGGDEGGVDA